MSRRPARRALAWYLEIGTEEYEEIAILTLAGRVGVDAAPRLEAAIATATRQLYPRLVLDLASLDYLSSAGLAVLERAAGDCAERHGTLVLACATEPVRLVLELAGLVDRVTLAPTREDAVSAVAAHSSHRHWSQAEDGRSM